jgi:hypothetical protein
LAVVAVKTAEAIETAAVTLTTVVVVMTTAKTAVVVVTDEKGDNRWHVRGNSGA